MRKTLFCTLCSFISKECVSKKTRLVKTLFFAGGCFILLASLTPLADRQDTSLGRTARQNLQVDEGDFVLEGTVAGLSDGYVYLSYTSGDGEYKTDSTLSKKGKFRFEGSINHPVFALFSNQRTPGSIDAPNLIKFYLEPGLITLSAKANDFKHARIDGSESQRQYEEFERSRELVTLKYKQQLDSLRVEKDHEKSAEIRERLAPYFSEIDQTDYRLFDKYPSSYVTAYMLRFHVSDLSLDSLRMFYDRLGKNIQESESGRDLAAEIQKLEWGSPGSMAKNFTATDINGDRLSLSDFKGKYVLLDFWASWCVPCRKGNPHLRELYAKYKGKGIEFIGISDDDSRPEAWRKAVEEDQLPWRHILRGFSMEKRRKNIPNEEDISDKFGIHTLPTKILIDRDGKIIGRYSSEEGPLDEMLEKIFDNSAAATVASGQKPFTIEGSIKGKTAGYLYINYPDAETGKRVMDSALIQKGRFTFKGKLDGPAEAMVSPDREASRANYLPLYIVPGSMQLSLDYNNFKKGAVLKGSPVQQEADMLNKLRAPVEEGLNPFSEAFDAANQKYIEARRAKKDEATLQALKDAADAAKNAMDPYYQAFEKIDWRFMDKYPASFVTASLLRYRLSGMPLKEGEERYSRLSATIKNSRLGKEIKEELDGLRMGSPGAKAFVFTRKELRGDVISLADYKGSYVLLDFWASWCVPCRKGNPHLRSLYSRYKGKGFEIIGVSDDDGNPEAWRKAVAQDGIGIWKHVLRGFDMEKLRRGIKNENDISNYYGIHTLPTKILIDPEGIIVGRYGGGGENDEAMDKKLAEIFD